MRDDIGFSPYKTVAIFRMLSLLQVIQIFHSYAMFDSPCLIFEVMKTK